MPNTIDFYFDFMSPYAYLAHQKLPDMADRHGYVIVYRPLDLGEAKQFVGNTGPANREIPVKHRHLRIDLKRWADLYGVAFSPPAGYGSARLNCGTFLANDRNVARKYVSVAWHLVWGLGGDMNDDILLRDVAHRMGWAQDEFLDYTVSENARTRLRDSQALAMDRGVFGVPMMVLGDEMWWGNDRLHFVENHLRTRAAG